MATYILLTKLTDHGRKTLKEKPNRVKEVNKEVEKMGGKVLAQYAVLGPYDFVNVLEAPDNKTIAKIASDMRKPDGLVVVPPGDEAAFLEPLPVRSLWGIGPKTEARLAGAGIRTVGQLARAPAETLATQFGSQAAFFQRMARGEDDRPVETESERKSVGAETTFPRDLPDGPDLREQLSRIAEEVAQRLVRQQTRARTVVLKLRYADFDTISRHRTLPEPTDAQQTLYHTVTQLLDEALAEKNQLVRLIGVGAQNLVDGGPQLRLWDPGYLETYQLNRALDRLRGRYGFLSVQQGRTFALHGDFPAEREGFVLKTPSLSR